MVNELISMFKNNYPFIVREEKTVKGILENKENYIIEKRNENNELIGVSVINKNTILMLCVNEKYRNHGIGNELLEQSENHIKKCGFDKVVLGVGFDYLMPGVPTSKKYCDSENENLYSNVIETEGKSLGSVGCTTVKPSFRRKHIAVNLVTLGTKYLKDIGMREAYLGYTYTGPDHMYGYAGYKICIYYMMAQKQI